MNKNRKDRKNKNLNEKNLSEKNIEKVSGGCGTKPCLPKDPIERRLQEEIKIVKIISRNDPSLIICKYGGANSFPWNKKEKKDNKIIFNTDENANE